jgi:putative FmdB family regulatory protein
LPTYAYRCADCGHRFETVQSFTDEALTVCPVCNGVLRKVFNAVGVVFKGSGFYRTDSRAASLASSGNGADAKSNGAETAAGDCGSGGNGKSASESATSSTSSSEGSSAGASSATDSSKSAGSSSPARSGTKTPTG